MHSADISELVRNAPRNCWIAFNDEETEVVGHGKTVDSAIDAANRRGIEKPILLWSPEEWIPTVY
jgi:hypothetical protein